MHSVSVVQLICHDNNVDTEGVATGLQQYFLIVLLNYRIFQQYVHTYIVIYTSQYFCPVLTKFVFL
jgi:hypothetical protein